MQIFILLQKDFKQKFWAGVFFFCKLINMMGITDSGDFVILTFSPWCFAYAEKGNVYPIPLFSFLLWPRPHMGLKLHANISSSVSGKFLILSLNSNNDSNDKKTFRRGESAGEGRLKPDFSFYKSGRGLKYLLIKWLRLTLCVNTSCTSVQRKRDSSLTGRSSEIVS